jgi:hypothetical protein
MMDPLFPAAPDDLATLSDDELQALLDAHLAVVTAIETRDEDMIGERSIADVLTGLEAGVETIDALRSEQAARSAAADEADAEMAALLARARGADETTADADADADAADADDADDDAAEDEDDDDAAEDTADADADAAAVVASARRARLGRVPMRRAARNQPPEHDDRRTRIVCAGDVPGFSAGAELTPAELSQAFSQRARTFAGVPHQGAQQKVYVGRLLRHYAQERMLDPLDAEGNWAKIAAVVGEEALVASGGICAPAEPLYDLQLLATDARPVRAALPSFNASRGGIRFAVPPGLGMIDDGVGIITEAEDAAGGTSALKTCLTIDCPEIDEVLLSAIYHCNTFGNMGARSWPEQIEHAIATTMAVHSRVADTALLDGIEANSTAVTGTQMAGAVNTLIGEVITAASAMRNRHRMAPDTVLRTLWPEWSLDLLLVDLARGQFNRFDQSRAGLTALLRTFNVEPSFYRDGATGAGQVFGAQNAGALLGFPSTVRWYLFPEGSFLVLDGGEIDLGIVRDSTLNSTNDFQMFGEIFENIAFVGHESLAVTTTVCASGEVTLPKSASGCVA